MLHVRIYKDITLAVIDPLSLTTGVIKFSQVILFTKYFQKIEKNRNSH